ncbi:MAG: hypothetical protein IKK72_04270 [Oscillospiraceae bacterium]|nr:hypothetical protein [Oscillospiraceae bacterium]
MEKLELLLDTGFFALGIACTVFVIMKRKRFDLWLSLPVCLSWVIKGVRQLYYDWAIFAAKNMRAEEIFPFLKRAHFITDGMDALVNILLCGALIRLVIVGLFSLWYKKAIKTVSK